MEIKRNQNPGGPFWGYQLDSTANPAHLTAFTTKMGQIGKIGIVV